MAWRYWHMEWVELQQQADAVAATSAQRVTLPPGAIDPLTVHKVDAVLPAGTKRTALPWCTSLSRRMELWWMLVRKMVLNFLTALPWMR